MNLPVTVGLLLAALTLNFALADERIHFPQDEADRTFENPKTTVNPVLRNSNCETATAKQQLLVYDSDTDSWGDEDVTIPTKNGTPCTEAADVNSSVNEGSPKPAVPQARPSRCDLPKQILVYNSDTDSWDETQWKNC